MGGRVTASPQADRAVGWAVEALRHAGVDGVHTEKFTIPAGWNEGHTHGEVLSPQAFSVRLASIGWSPATPDGGITSEVIDAQEGDDRGFAEAGETAKGAIVLIHTKILATRDDLDNEVDLAITRRARKAGVAAIFWMSTRPNLSPGWHSIVVDGQIGLLPQAVVAREDAERIVRFLASGQKVRVHFEMPNHVSGPAESENVVAEIRGREKPDEFVLLGAHLDFGELGTGAHDNGCDVALVIDAARVIHASGVVPRRSIRFVLFTGEEQGLLGSWAWARAHRAELDRMAAAVIFESGAGPVTGYSLGGRKDMLAAVRETLEPARSLGVKDFTLDAALNTDQADFILEGVPTLVARQKPANYPVDYHAAAHTFDKVDIAQLKMNVAIAAVSAYALADAVARIGPRQTRAQIEQLMTDTGIDKEIKLEGLWPAWEKGDRGRQP
jgi:hypothetical protein